MTAEINKAVAFMEKAGAMLGRGEMPAPATPFAVEWHAAHATILSELSRLLEENERQATAFDLLVSSVLCARTSNTPEYMTGLAEDINEALGAFGDHDRVAFERHSLRVIRADRQSKEGE